MAAMLHATLSSLQNPSQTTRFTPSTTSSSSSPLFFSSGCYRLPVHSIGRRYPILISCSSFRGRGTGRGRGRGRGGGGGRDSIVDYERRPLFKWNEIFKRISVVEDPEIGAAGVLNQCENEGKTFVKWELCRVVRELRKFRKYKLAIQVYQWMNNRTERFHLFSSDMAIQLDLIAKVHGIPSAEDFFIRIPEIQKDNRVYGALLNAYAGAKSRDKAESLMETMRSKGYASEPLPYNVMMTLYMKLKEFDKVDSLISELKNKNIRPDIYSYNIWLSARGSQPSVDGFEEVFEELKRDEVVRPNWSTYATMASLYIKLGQVEKAEDCLRSLEMNIAGRNRLPYHYLLNMYGSLGNKDEVYRVWSIYKTLFFTISNWGYHSMIGSLVKVGDIEGAERVYEEWLSVKTMNDVRISNILLSSYVSEGEYEKAERFFSYVGETGGKPIPVTWEILGVCRIKQGRLSDALNCFREAFSCEGSENWKPRPGNVSLFWELCEQEGDQTAKEFMVGLLRQLGCSNIEAYKSVVGEYVEAVNGAFGADLGDENEGSDNEGSELLFSMAE